jgi:phosphoketolase
MKKSSGVLTPGLLGRMDVYWRATNYLSLTYICQHGEDLPEIRDWKWKTE